MINDIYNAKILELAANIPHIGTLEAPMATATVHAKLCGSKLTAMICMKDGKISDFAQDVEACALGQASASIVAHSILGASPQEIYTAADTMAAMLKGEREFKFDERFSDLRYLEPIKDYKARHASTLLIFDVLKDCLKQLEQKAA